MISCSGCKRQQPGVDVLCLACIEDLNAWLREIPDLYDELNHVRLPGSVRTTGPSVRTSGGGSAAPVRLEVVDLLDRGGVIQKLEVWAGGELGTVREMCDNMRHHLFSVTMLSAQDAGDFYRTIKALCRDLGRTVGEPQDQPVGKCSRPIDGDRLCRGQIFRSVTAAGVVCRRCGDKPELREQEVWVTLEQAARVIGKPIETVRTWYKRGKLGYWPQWLDHAKTQPGWSEPIGPQPPRMAWLPTAARLANGVTTTVPHSSGMVNHGSGAELSSGSVDDQSHEPQSPGAGDRLDRGTPDPLTLDRSSAAAVRAGEETPSRLPHGRDGVSPASQAAGSGEAWRVDTTCDDPGPADSGSP